MSAGTRIAVWDGWRGVAILLVLIGHFTFSSWVWEERLGVDVFFVLSGMLMSNILFVDRMNLRDFYIRRLSRVVPALIVFLAGALFVSIIMKYEFKIIEFVSSLFFLRTYFPIEPEYFAAQPPTGHLWSLNVEEHSYVAMSLISLVLVAKGRIASALFAIYVASVVINFVNYANLSPREFEYSLIRTESAMGFIAFSAAYNLVRRDRAIKVHEYLPLILCLLSFVFYFTVMPIWLTFLLGPVCLGVAVNHLLDSAKVVQKVLTFSPLRWLGILSYSVYLWQQIFYKLYYALPGKALTGFVLSIVIGAGSFFIIENPARKYINNRWCPKPAYRAAGKAS